MGYITAVVDVRQVAGDQPWPQLPPIFNGSPANNRGRKYRPFSMGRWRSTVTGCWLI